MENSDEKPKVKKKRPGRKREKTQISVRLNEQLLEMTAGLMKKKGRRVSDALEQGLMLYINRISREPLALDFARFMISWATPEEATLIGLFAVYLRYPNDDLSVFNSVDREAIKKKLAMLPQMPKYQETVASYGEFPPAGA